MSMISVILGQFREREGSAAEKYTIMSSYAYVILIKSDLVKVSETGQNTHPVVPHSKQFPNLYFKPLIKVVKCRT